LKPNMERAAEIKAMYQAYGKKKAKEEAEAAAMAAAAKAVPPPPPSIPTAPVVPSSANKNLPQPTPYYGTGGGGDNKGQTYFAIETESESGSNAFPGVIDCGSSTGESGYDRSTPSDERDELPELVDGGSSDDDSECDTLSFRFSLSPDRPPGGWQARFAIPDDDSESDHPDSKESSDSDSGAEDLDESTPYARAALLAEKCNGTTSKDARVLQSSVATLA
jgi:hypothetical protein